MKNSIKGICSIIVGGFIGLGIQSIRINKKKKELEESLATIEALRRDAEALRRDTKCLENLQASIELARAVGVPEDKILHNHEEGEAFFMS